MAESPIITFKAGLCTLEGKKVIPVRTSGYIYLYEEDELLHFCWRPRSAPAASPEIDLIAFPGDCTFQPYTRGASSDTSPTNGRIFVLKFASSLQRYFFWMQSKSQHREGQANWFSKRDKEIGVVINTLLQGEDVDVETWAEGLRDRNGGGGGGDDDDDEMEDVQGPDDDRLRRQSTGGAGADATGGDPREEGEASREGGADGGRAASGNAPSDANAAVQNFLRSLQSPQSQSTATSQAQQDQGPYDHPFTTLTELLNTDTTIPWLSTASPSHLDTLCSYLPPQLFLLAQESASTLSASADPSPAVAQAAIEAMSVEQKRSLLARVLRSPQLRQSLGSLTVAIRDGGLPMIAEALGVKVQHGGLVRGGSVPLGGGAAVEAFLEGVKRGVEEEKREGKK